jgi:hypothetical protein
MAFCVCNGFILYIVPSKFLDVFAKLRKATIILGICVCLSVRPSLRKKIFGFYYRDLHSLRYLSIFRKSVKKIQV